MKISHENMRVKAVSVRAMKFSLFLKISPKVCQVTILKTKPNDMFIVGYLQKSVMTDLQ